MVELLIVIYGFILLIVLLFVHITRLFYRQVCFISKGLVGVLRKER